MNQIQLELERFKKDTAYYEAHHDELLEKFPEQWVAIFDQQVVGASPDYEKLLHSVHAQGYSVGQVLFQFLTNNDESFIL